MKPTIGRVVLVYRYGLSDQPEPAVICYVHSDRCINVGGVDHNGAPFSATSIELLQPGDQTPAISGRPYARWRTDYLSEAIVAEKAA